MRSNRLIQRMKRAMRMPGLVRAFLMLGFTVFLSNGILEKVLEVERNERERRTQTEMMSD